MKKVILSVALLATTFTCSNAATIEELTKDALINAGSHKLSGTFGAYDFDPKGDKGKFDWAFTTSSGKTYQLRGNDPTPDNVFGWASTNIITPPTPAWYMFQVDVDSDGLGPFDWVLLGANSNYATKLKGVADSGSFEYTGKIDIDYDVSGSSISTGIVGAFDENSDTNSYASLLAGKTLYVGSTKEHLESWTLNKTATVGTWQDIYDINGYDNSGVVSVNISETTMTTQDDGETNTFTFKEVTNDYVLISFLDEGEVQNLRMYFNRNKAEIYYQIPPAPTSANYYANLLAGKTLYVGSTKEHLESWTVDYTATVGTWQDIYDINGYDNSGVVSVNISGTTMITQDDDERNVMTFVEATDDYVVISFNNDGEIETIRMYFNRNKAEIYYQIP